MSEKMTWTCVTCHDGGDGTDPTQITMARVDHIRSSPGCNMVIVEWPRLES